jgi:hypothetical protein
MLILPAASFRAPGSIWVSGLGRSTIRALPNSLQCGMWPLHTTCLLECMEEEHRINLGVGTWEILFAKC